MFRVIIACLLLATSCFSEDEGTLSPTGFLRMVRKKDPSVKQVPIPTEQAGRRILCSHYKPYGSGCIPGFGMRLKVGLVELVAVRFETSSQAALVAKNIDQWYLYNWVLDNVNGGTHTRKVCGRSSQC